MKMDQDIFIVSRSSGQWEDSYTIPIFYTTDEALAKDTARWAKDEWISAMAVPMPSLDCPDGIDNWSDEQWDIFNNGREDSLLDFYEKRKALLITDPDAPHEDNDIVSYSVRSLSAYKGS
jgi:hypothetical protein